MLIYFQQKIKLLKINNKILVKNKVKTRLIQNKKNKNKKSLLNKTKIITMKKMKVKKLSINKIIHYL